MQKITLGTVRSIADSMFGRDSFISTFISEVEVSDETSTACIDTNGVLKYNQSFVNTYVNTRSDLVCLLMHELFHPMFDFPSHLNDDHVVENIGMDAIINSILFLYPDTHEGSLFKKYYKDLPNAHSILRSNSTKINHTKFKTIYHQLYNNHNEPVTTADVILALKLLIPKPEDIQLKLIGSHNDVKKDTESNNNLSKSDMEVLSKIAYDIKKLTMEKGLMPSNNYFPCMKILLNVLNKRINLRKNMLNKFLTHKKLDNFTKTIKKNHIQITPVPIQLSKREIVQIASGSLPIYYHKNTHKNHEEGKYGLVVYLDVSGSILFNLPHIISILRGFKDQLKSIFTFSFGVKEISFEKILNGDIKTNYATNFNSVIEHILEKKYDRVIFISDGYGEISSEYVEKIKKEKVKFLSILTSDIEQYSSQNLKKIGDTIDINDIIA